MNKVSLDDLIRMAEYEDANRAEETKAYASIRDTSSEVAKAAKSGSVKILTDYDVDGICSAYVMEKSIKLINPDCEVSVTCNDRRNGYGLSEDIRRDEGDNSRYIILDMGTNQLDFIKERLGADTIVIDHHLPDGGKTALQFQDSNQPGLLNLHCLHEEDSLNAQYCTSGLAYRIAETAGLFKDEYDESVRNSITAMACIGTVSDVVDLSDQHGFNKEIVREGIKAINNADRENFDFVIGNVLARCGVNEQTTAQELAFNVGAFLNAASRMSEITKENGAQRMYDALTGDPDSSKTYKEIEALAKLNVQRKAYINELTQSDAYKDFVSDERYGTGKDDNIAIYILPDNTPSSFAGLIANKLTDATDKAVIALTYNTEKDKFIGSGRNADSNATGLKDFLDKALEDSDINITYGGHKNAIGISSLSTADIVSFAASIAVHGKEMERRAEDEKTVLDIDWAELKSPNTMAKIMELEPIGEGTKIPLLQVEGKELNRGKDFLKDRPDWKTIKVANEDGKKLSVKDWSYDERTYPKNDSDSISLMAEVKLNYFRGNFSTEATAVFSRKPEGMERELELNREPSEYEKQKLPLEEETENEPANKKKGGHYAER